MISQTLYHLNGNEKNSPLGHSTIAGFTGLPVVRNQSVSTFYKNQISMTSPTQNLSHSLSFSDSTKLNQSLNSSNLEKSIESVSLNENEDPLSSTKANDSNLENYINEKLGTFWS